MYILRNRILAVTLALCMIVTSVSVTAATEVYGTSSSAAEIVGSGTFGVDGDNLSWTADSDGVVTISGKGDMDDYDGWSYAPWVSAYSGTDHVTKVIIQDGVTSIGAEVFYSEDNLTSVEIADSVKTIGEGAFSFCTALNEIDFPSNLTSISSRAFSSCTKLTRVILPKQLQLLEDFAFYDCDNLKAALFLNPDTIIDGSPFAATYDIHIYALETGAVKTYAESDWIPFTLLDELKVKDFYLTESLGTNSVTLTWTPVSLTDGYYIYKYNTSTKKYEKKYTVSADQKSYKLTGLKSGTVYQYQIKSFLQVNEETYTSAASKLKFRTKSSSSTITAKNDKIDDGYAASVKTVTKTYSRFDADTNINYGHYTANVSPVSQFTDDKGNFCIAYKNPKGTYLYIRAFNKNMEQVYSRKIKPLYSIVGGVTCDENGYFYIVWGKEDYDDKTGTITMAISKHKKDGTLVKTFKYKTSMNSDPKLPFRSGNCDIAIKDGILVCSFSRLMYNGHQSSSTFTIDTATMKDLDTYYNYVSHSFDQRVLFDKDGVAWFVDHGDAYPRGFGVATYGGEKSADYEPFHFYADESAMDDMFVLNKTNARLGGIVETSSGLVLVGSSVKSLKSSGYNSQKKNLFIMYADPAKKMLDGVSRSGYCLGDSVTDKGVKWLTSYTSYDVDNPQVIYTDNDRIVVLWEKVKDGQWVSTHYMILSANGKILQKATKIKGVKLNANEEPIYKDGYIYWATGSYNYNTGTKLKLHRLNLSTLTFDKTSLKVKGLKVSSKTKSSVSLKWNKVSNADGYRIYKYNSSKKKYVEVKTVKASTLKYTVKSLSKGKNYTLAVKAYKKINGKTYWSDYTKIKVKTKS